MSSKGIAGFNAGLVKSVSGGYTPTEWATGDVITADKLNHIEEGIKDNDSLYINEIADEEQGLVILDAIANDIYDAFTNNKQIVIKLANTMSYLGMPSTGLVTGVKLRDSDTWGSVIVWVTTLDPSENSTVAVRQYIVENNDGHPYID